MGLEVSKFLRGSSAEISEEISSEDNEGNSRRCSVADCDVCFRSTARKIKSCPRASVSISSKLPGTEGGLG